MMKRLNLGRIWSVRCGFGPLLVALVAALVAGGCRASMPASASFASVVISNRSVDEIRAATIAVFAAQGYQALLGGGDELVLEREGSRGEEIAHGAWVGEAGVINRVRAAIVELAPGQYRLQCRAYVVRNADDPVLEDAIRLGNARSRPYQKALNEVAARLK